MEKICLDTEVLIDFLRGDRAIVEKLKNYAAREELCITPISLFYLYRTVKKTEVVDAFANAITILPLDAAGSIKASEISQELAEKGMDKTMDVVLTSAVCIVNHSFLFTKDRKKFDGIRGLKLV